MARRCTLTHEASGTRHSGTGDSGLLAAQQTAQVPKGRGGSREGTSLGDLAWGPAWDARAPACTPPRKGGPHGGPARAPRLRRSAQIRCPPPLVKWTGGSQAPETARNSGPASVTGSGGNGEAQVTKWAGATPAEGHAVPRGPPICHAREAGKIKGY